MTRNQKNLAEKKLLLAVFSTEVFEGRIIRQERPICCGVEIDLLEAKLTFLAARIHNKDFTMLEPYCPLCGNKVRASYRVLS
jgi:hypothetical protein